MRSSSGGHDAGLSKLLREVRACTLCVPHLPLGPNPVLQAAAGSRILVVGQAPGTRVHATSIPFNDPSGVRLRRWMHVDAATFYDAARIALIPMGFCYPGKGSGGDLPPRAECAQTWRERLLSRLPNIELTLVIGQYAQAYHLGERRKSTLTETVRAWRDYWPERVPLPHPSPRNNIWLKKNPWFEAAVIPVLRKRVAEILH